MSQKPRPKLRFPKNYEEKIGRIMEREGCSTPDKLLRKTINKLEEAAAAATNNPPE